MGTFRRLDAQTEQGARRTALRTEDILASVVVELQKANAQLAHLNQQIAWSNAVTQDALNRQAAAPQVYGQQARH